MIGEGRLIVGRASNCLIETDARLHTNRFLFIERLVDDCSDAYPEIYRNPEKRAKEGALQESRTFSSQF